MKSTLFGACAAAALLAMAPAHADDSSAALGAGGLVLTQNADIRMASEDLRLSPNAVDVRYEFVNDSGKDIDTIVAFPLPDVDLYEYSESPLGTVKNTTPNFVGFALTVDGKPVAAEAEERAIYKGRDVTQLVREAGLPVNLVNPQFEDKLGKLPAAARDKLVKAGIMEIDGDPHPKWVAQTKFWWRQHFPAGKTVAIEHRYQPVTGQSFFSELALSEADESAYYRKNFCLDKEGETAIAAKIAKLGKPKGQGLLEAYTTDFVLVTANNWKGPIGHFHLTVDKLKPENILSLCWDGTLTKASATAFEATEDNFAPKRDVQLLVLETLPPGQD